MELVFERDGVLVRKLSQKSNYKYVKHGKCPICECDLQVYATGWKRKDFVYICGENVGKFKIMTCAMCPICGNYFDKSFKPIEDGLEFYKDL